VPFALRATAPYAAPEKQQSVPLFLCVASGKLHLPQIERQITSAAHHPSEPAILSGRKK
jgi:hypothetical protein